MRQFFQEAGFEETLDGNEADRSIVVGPAERWIFVGDSAGSTEWDEHGFDSLSLALSTQAPVVATKMSDGAAIHFYLFRDGPLEDNFGNAAFPFYRFSSEEEAVPFRGRPELWADLLMDPDRVPALRAAWVQEWQAHETLAATARGRLRRPRPSGEPFEDDKEHLARRYPKLWQRFGARPLG